MRPRTAPSPTYVGTAAGQIKTGSPGRSDRVSGTTSCCVSKSSWPARHRTRNADPRLIRGTCGRRKSPFFVSMLRARVQTLCASRAVAVCQYPNSAESFHAFYASPLLVVRRTDTAAGWSQYRLWVGEGSLAQVNGLNKQIAEQQGENERLFERNRILEAEFWSSSRAWRPSRAGPPGTRHGRGRNLYQLSNEPARSACLLSSSRLPVSVCMRADRPAVSVAVSAALSNTPIVFWTTRHLLVWVCIARRSLLAGAVLAGYSCSLRRAVERCDSVLVAAAPDELGANEHDCAVHDGPSQSGA